MEKARFNQIKTEIILALKTSSVDGGNLDGLREIIQKNKEFLSQESSQKLLMEFIDSEEFHRLSLDSVGAKPFVRIVIPFVMTYIVVDYLMRDTPSPFLWYMVTAYIAVYGGSLVAELFTDYFVLSKFNSLNLPKRSIFTVLGRTQETCKNVFLLR